MIIVGFIALALASSAALWPQWRRRRAVRQRQQAIDASLADVADFLIVVLGAGSSLAESIRWLAERGPEVTQHAFVTVIERGNAGRPLTVAVAGITDDLGTQYRPMVAALIATIRDGSPTSSLLLRLGDEARAARVRQNERLARSLPVHMLFPLVCCALPAVVVGAVVPLVLVAVGRL
jgi:tight adherence protein C